MQKDERFLPRQITRFNYWTFEIASTKPPHLLNSTVQRLGEYPDVQWRDRSGRGAAHRHIQQTFLLLLNASPAVWNEKVLPVFHLKLADIPDRPFFALKYYVEDDKEWRSDETAQGVLKQLSPPQRAAILRLNRTTWPERSKRPRRLSRTWENLFSDIARDLDIFERLCETPPGSDQLSGTEKRIYLSYSKQATKLLGGGTGIPAHRRKVYRDAYPDLLVRPTLLDDKGRLPSETVFAINWNELTTKKERREAKKHTLHWFHHALRNMREYRNGRNPIPWTAECENTCRRIQKKLLNP